MHTYVYTFINGKIEYIGNAPAGSCFYLPQSQFAGIWSSTNNAGNFEGEFYTYYYYKDGNQIKDELVLTDNGLGGNVVRKTSNIALFEASDIAEMSSLTKEAVDEIWKMGWDAFVSKQLLAH